MIAVYLYGHLAKEFGKKHILAIKSPAEAIRALSANYPSFKKRMIESNYSYRVVSGDEDRAYYDGLHMRTKKTIKIIPLVAGSGSLGKILLGAALIGLSFYLPMTSFGLTEAGLFLTSAVSSVGFSLILGGISGLLFAPPKPERGLNEKPENKPSYSFNGAINTTGQGNPVPVAYGRRIRVGSQVASAGLSSENLAI